MTTISSVRVQELFIIPNLNDKAKVLVKDMDGNIRVTRGPDHHGRVIYGQTINPNSDTVVQLLDRNTITEFLTD